MKRNIIVFGGAGFIGSNFIRKLVNKDFFFINVDALTYASSKKNLNDLKKFKNYKFIKLNIINSNSEIKFSHGRDLKIKHTVGLVLDIFFTSSITFLD